MGDDAGVEGPRRAFDDSPVEDQADLGGTAQVDVFADDLLEQVAPGQGPVEHLGARELCLQDGQLGVEARRVVRSGEGIGQAREPLAHQRLDLGCVEFVEDLLQAHRIGTGQYPVVERLKGDPLLGQLPLGVLMAVEADPCGVGEVGGELDEQGAEVLVHQVEVVLVAQPGDLILALSLGKSDHLHSLALGEVADRLDKGMAHRPHQRRRGHLGPAVDLEEGRHPAAGLQHGLVQVQVQPVDPFDVQNDLPLQQFAHGLSYHDSRPRLTSWLHATRRFARLLTEV